MWFCAEFLSLTTHAKQLETLSTNLVSSVPLTSLVKLTQLTALSLGGMIDLKKVDLAQCLPPSLTSLRVALIPTDENKHELAFFKHVGESTSLRDLEIAWHGPDTIDELDLSVSSVGQAALNSLSLNVAPEVELNLCIASFIQKQSLTKLHVTRTRVNDTPERSDSSDTDDKMEKWSDYLYASVHFTD